MSCVVAGRQCANSGYRRGCRESGRRGRVRTAASDTKRFAARSMRSRKPSGTVAQILPDDRDTPSVRTRDACKTDSSSSNGYCTYTPSAATVFPRGMRKSRKSAIDVIEPQRTRVGHVGGSASSPKPMHRRRASIAARGPGRGQSPILSERSERIGRCAERLFQDVRFGRACSRRRRCSRSDADRARRDRGRSRARAPPWRPPRRAVRRLGTASI